MRTMITLAAAAALALPLGAQHMEGEQHEGPPRGPRAGMMQNEGGMGMPLMMEIHTFNPQALLDRGELLGLSAQQIQRLTALQAEAQAAHDRAHEESQARLAEAKTAWDGGNMQVANAATQAGMQAMQAAHLGMLSAAGQARGILTAEQRARVQGWMDAAQMRQHEMQMRQHQMRERGEQMRERRPGMQLRMQSPPRGGGRGR